MITKENEQRLLTEEEFHGFVSFDSCLAAFQDGFSETESSACNAVVSSERELAEPEKPPVSYRDCLNSLVMVCQFSQEKGLDKKVHEALLSIEKRCYKGLVESQTQKPITAFFQKSV